MHAAPASWLVAVLLAAVCKASECQLWQGMGDYSLHPHAGFLHLDQTAGDKYVLTHALTLERKPLAPGEWLAEFDSDGFACLVNVDSQDAEAIFAEDILTRKLLIKNDGELFVEEVKSLGGTGETWSLTAMQQRHVEGKIKLALGSNKQKFNITVAYFKWPRLHAHTYVSIMSVYNALGLTSFKQQWSKWAWNGAARWDTYLAKHGLKGHVIHSSIAARAPVLGGAPGAVAELAQGGLSFCSLLALACRWWAAGPKQGRLDRAEDRISAAYLLEGLVKASCGLGAWKLHLQVLKTWLPRWPRPELPEPTVACTVENCVLDIKPLSVLAEAGNVHATSWVREVREACGDEHQLHLKRLMQVAQDSITLQPLLTQLFWRLGERLEVVVLTGRRKGVSGPDMEVPIDANEMELTACHPSVQDAHIAKYVYSSVEASRGQDCFSIATDKGQIGGLSLMNSIIVYPSNLAVICPPVV